MIIASTMGLQAEGLAEPDSMLGVPRQSKDCKRAYTECINKAGYERKTMETQRERSLIPETGGKLTNKLRS